jgi:hypothetical protein
VFDPGGHRLSALAGSATNLTDLVIVRVPAGVREVADLSERMGELIKHEPGQHKPDLGAEPGYTDSVGV